ncbi:MAG: hypothetical protein H4O13_00205 [Xanthomonadales bacterium]|nr:hypothetical protein [Xanthomonadales bacterium]
MKRVRIVWLVVWISALAACDPPNRLAEQAAVPTEAHPYAGFWKEGSCAAEFGLAIAPADERYSVSFCGPGGCFAPGTYRPNTKLVDDQQYRIIDNDTIEVTGVDGFARYVRCSSR